jgi:excisionase family DNA binding protein
MDALTANVSICYNVSMFKGHVPVRKAAERLGVHWRTIIRWMQEEKIPHVRFNGRNYLTEECVDQIERELTEPRLEHRTD